MVHCLVRLYALYQKSATYHFKKLVGAEAYRTLALGCKASALIQNRAIVVFSSLWLAFDNGRSLGANRLYDVLCKSGFGQKVDCGCSFYGPQNAK